MSRNPYQPPRASLVSASSHMPRSIKLALIILSISVMIHTLYPLWIVYASGSLTGREPWVVAGIVIALCGGSLWVAVFLLFIGLKHNWARWTWLALMLLLWFFELLPKSDAYERSILAFVVHGMEMVGTLPLFFGPGARWFKREPKAVERA